MICMTKISVIKIGKPGSDLLVNSFFIVLHCDIF